MSGAPFKKLPASPGVGSTSVPVADRGGEEVNVGFTDLGTGSGNQLRDPRARRRAGNDRKFSHVSLCELFGVELYRLFGVFFEYEQLADLTEEARKLALDRFRL
jgi:hypothetical protein